MKWQELRKLHIEELHYLFFTTSVIGIGDKMGRVFVARVFEKCEGKG